MFTPISAEEYAKIKAEKKAKAKERRELEALNKRHLGGLRVVHRGVIYIMGLPSKMLNEDVLRHPSNFGQFGKINRIILNRRPVNAPPGTQHAVFPPLNLLIPAGQLGLTTGNSPGTAYVVYNRREDAETAQQEADMTAIDGKLIRVTFATSKYCGYYLRGTTCQTAGCLYMHETAEDNDVFTKNEQSSGKAIYSAHLGPALPNTRVVLSSSVLSTNSSLSSSTDDVDQHCLRPHHGQNRRLASTILVYLKIPRPFWIALRDSHRARVHLSSLQVRCP